MILKKLSKLKLSILKYKAGDSSDDMKEVKENNEIMKQLKSIDESNHNHNIDANRMADLVSIVIKPVNKHYEQLKKIGIIINNTEISSLNKIEEIGNLLL